MKIERKEIIMSLVLLLRESTKKGTFPSFINLKFPTFFGAGRYKISRPTIIFTCLAALLNAVYIFLQFSATNFFLTPM
uniref:Uncharacterized protein n=1 Tax=Romanomermis culicivorax TaxID=13658 RepID=A0A915KUY5_ROMCU